MELKQKNLGKREAREIHRDLERKAELVGLNGWVSTCGLVVMEVREKEGLLSEGHQVFDLADFEKLEEFEGFPSKRH